MKTTKFSHKEKQILSEILKLKNKSGTHSPSIVTLTEQIQDLDMKVDACFLSNPYATELFLKYLNQELIETRKIRDVLEFYPSQNNILSSLLSPVLEISEDNIFVGNGAIEIIQAVLNNFIGEKILINIPTFSSYYEFVPKGVEIVYNNLLQENNFLLDIDNYIEIVKKEKPSTVVLINPNNPDGNFLDSKKVIFLLESLSEVSTIIIDESFIHFAFESKEYNLLTYTNLVKNFPNLIVIKSMSKDFGIAGIRAGYAVMRPERVEILNSSGYLWNVNGLAEYFFRLYARPEFMKQYEYERKKYIIESQIFFQNLSKIEGIKVYPSMSNFALVEILGEWDSDSFVMYCLIKHGIYMRTCSDKIGLNGSFVRIASRSQYENKLIINAIKEAVS